MYFYFNTDCWFTLLVLLFSLEKFKKKKRIKKKNKKKSSENDQLTGHFQSFFFFSSPDPKSEKNPVN